MFLDDTVRVEKEEAGKLREKINQKRRHQRKEKKVRRSDVRKVSSLHPFRAVLRPDCLKQKKRLTDYYEIGGLNLDSLQEADKVSAIIEFSFFLRKYHPDLKLIFMNFPANTQQQIEFISKKIRVTNNTDYYPFQEERRRELSVIQKTLTHQEFYVQIFAEDEKELHENRKLLLSCSRQHFKIRDISLEKKLQILYKLDNLNSDYIQFGEDVEHKDWAAGINKDGYDEELLGYIQPQGGIAFSERYMHKGDGYETCLHIYGYPRRPGPFWANGVFNRKGVVTVVDIHTIDKNRLLPALDRSVTEQEARYDEATKQSQKSEALSELESLNQLIADIISDDESAKEINTRMYLSAPTLEELEERVKALQQDLKPLGFNAQIFLAEAKAEWLALFTDYSEQKALMHRMGQEIKSLSLAGSFPFDFTQLLDPRGLYMGFTPTEGVVVLDMTHKDTQRLSYNYSGFGTMGSGKSTLLKILSEHTVILGNNNFVFAVSAEFDRLCQRLGGSSMNMNGSDGTVNPWQVFATVLDEASNEIDEHGSFMAFVDALKINYRFLSGERDAKEEKEFIKLSTAFYNSLPLEMDKITQYPADAYPTYSDFRKWLQETYYENGHLRKDVDTYEAKRIDGIMLTVTNIVETYPRIFDRKTSLPPLDSMKFGVFNLESLLKQDKNVFNAQLFSVFNMVWDHAIKVGHMQKKLYDLGQIDLSDVVYTNIIWDEFHNTVKSGNVNVMEAIDRLAREGRKYFCQIGLFSQNFDDVLPQNVNGDMEKILTAIFGNTTYKFIMKQTPEATERIRRAFRSQLSERELDMIPGLSTGDTILNISGYGNIHFHIELPAAEQAIFDGGA
ncbi:VirB4 family type IV secretion system protein [Sporolactobacillus sp. KGMB 08714]|uniref:VirB4 family type IV secretion system protein n=1 Tax=Sporolactobacillus sp. KGMB 08714 TaxID=3064704 RepID=UPI002FBE805B